MQDIHKSVAFHQYVHGGGRAGQNAILFEYQQEPSEFLYRNFNGMDLHLNERLSTASMGADKRALAGVYTHMTCEIAPARKGFSAMLFFANMSMRTLILIFVLLSSFLPSRSGAWCHGS
jgi:hypothetical protein